VIWERLRAGNPEARLLPAEKLHGPTTAVTAIMTFAMVVVAAAGLALANAASAVSEGAENSYIIQIPSAAASDLPKAVAAARSLPQVRSITPVPQSEMRDALKRWLGEAAESSDLPVPAMATVELAPGSDPAPVEAAVRKRVAEASFATQSSELKPVLGSLRALQWLALSLVLLMASATAAAIVLAARGALNTHRSTVEIMHGIGATDAQVTRLFERKIAGDSIAGALLGTAGGAIVLLLLGSSLAAAAGGLESAPLGFADAGILALVPLGAVVIAVAVARSTLLRALRATL
jgi:cell division transport system permease protein